MKKKYWLIFFIMIIIALICFFIFNKNKVKLSKIGNNKNSQEIVDYILNISSYEVQITVNVTSNKNSNKYILKQTFTAPDQNMQEVVEPSNISGVKIQREGTNLKVENTTLNLSTIFENYNYLGDNCLDLSSFIEDYKQDAESKFEENEQEIIMKAGSNIESKYIKHKILYIDKKTYKPTKLEIKDDNLKTVIYILYNEVKINSTK